MKFKNGEWLVNEGYGMLCPEAVCEVEITAPMPEALKVKAYHYAGVDSSHDVSFDLNLSDASFLEAEETEDSVMIRSGTLTLTVDKADCAMSGRGIFSP